MTGERVNVLQPDTGTGRQHDVHVIDVVDGDPHQFKILGAVIVQDPEFIASIDHHVFETVLHSVATRPDRPKLVGGAAGI